MSMGRLAQDLATAGYVIHAVFLYAACTEDGYVKVGISRTPFERLYAIHCNSPSPVRAAKWAWVGSINLGREIERRLAREWAHRHTRGEWFRFDYSLPADKADFHDTLAAVFEVVVGQPPEWKTIGPEEMRALVAAGNKEARAPR